MEVEVMVACSVNRYGLVEAKDPACFSKKTCDRLIRTIPPDRRPRNAYALTARELISLCRLK